MSKKSRNFQNKIILNENDKIISNNEEVADIFNDYFANVANGIGKDYVFNPSDHPSLKMINAKQFEKNAFESQATDQETVSKIIDKFNPKKATCADKISVKLLKLTKDTIVEPITDLINTQSKPAFSQMLSKEIKFPLCLKKVML